MLKGKNLYKAAREFAEEAIPKIDEEDLSESEKNELAQKSAELGVALAIDIAESLHRISVKFK